jgi:hypothetical protein
MVDGGAPKDFPTKLFKQLEPASLGMVDGGVRKDFPTEIFQNTNRSENEVFDLPVPKARTLDELKQYTGLSMMQLGPLPILDMGMVDRPATSVTAEVAKVESDQLKVRVKPAERPRDSEGPSL